jgi:hypothetical protein
MAAAPHLTPHAAAWRGNWPALPPSGRKHPGRQPEHCLAQREQRRAARAKPGPPGLLGQAAADGKIVRGAVRADGSQVHLLSVLDVATGCVRAQREISAKTNQIPELAPAIAHDGGL